MKSLLLLVMLMALMPGILFFIFIFSEWITETLFDHRKGCGCADCRLRERLRKSRRQSPH